MNDVKQLAQESKQYFRNDLGEFIYYRTYSRWMEDQGRRETWVETVDRYLAFMKENVGDKITEGEYAKIRANVLAQKVMPSMRLMWSAGPAAKRTNVTAYNCSFIAPSQLADFGEIMYVSMCGTGVGFSVEQHTVDMLPEVKMQSGDKPLHHTVDDSKEGWAEAFVLGLKTWFDGKDIEFDYSQLRPAGARLKTMGGQSSGPQPLIDLMNYSREKILAAQGGKLSTLDVHDIICKIGEIVVAGGVRRSAMISLSDLNDDLIRHAKDGEFWNTNLQRVVANNSAVYNQKPEITQFMEEWLALSRSGSGERGIFNRGGLQKQMPKRRWDVFESGLMSSGTNPCGEIVLKSKQFCNLTEVIARENDTLETLMEKVEVATILGTYQSTLTHFEFLSPEWKKNSEEERLLGVSVTGQWDCPAVRDADVLNKLREHAIEVNKKYAARLGINASTAITCVKPSGTVSQLVDASSGMHPRHAPYYIRRVRIAATDPLFKMLAAQGVKYVPEIGQTMETAHTFVLEFPVKAPENTKVFKDTLTAIEQLEHWKLVKTNYTEHNPSVTISIGNDEWLDVASWLYKNWEIIGGLSFLPREDHVYQLAPYEAITKEQYDAMVEKQVKVDYSQILEFEGQDETKGAKELACVAGACEVV